MHYMRWYRHGDPLWGPPPKVVEVCLTPGCEAVARKRGMCVPCYGRWQRGSPGNSQSAEYRRKRGQSKHVPVYVTCANPDCNNQFEKLYKPGRPQVVCSPECGKALAVIRVNLWHQEFFDRDPEGYREWQRRCRAKTYRNAKAKHRVDEEQYQIALAKARARMQLPNARANRALRGALARGSPYGELITYEELYERDKGICQICLKYVPFKEMTMDHWIPCTKQGPHVLGNLKTAHRHCNVQKQATLPVDLAVNPA